MFQSQFSILGMTCEACVKTVTEKLSSIEGVNNVTVKLDEKQATIVSDKKISLPDVRKALSESPKYTAQEYNTQIVETEASLLKTYKPLVAIFVFVILVSLAFQTSLPVFTPRLFMNHLMAGFFVGLSFFKFLDLTAFSESFSSYDPLAQKWNGYGKIYPFVELYIGLLFISGKMLTLANVLTILVLSLTTYGVYLRLQSNSKFQCACLGTTFNLPLSNVTIGENVAMILMALYGLAM